MRVLVVLFSSILFSISATAHGVPVQDEGDLDAEVLPESDDEPEPDDVEFDEAEPEEDDSVDDSDAEVEDDDGELAPIEPLDDAPEADEPE